MTPVLVPSFLFKRKADTHKGDYGHVLIVAGSVGMTGAPVLCAESALRSGAGWVTLAVPKSVYPVVARKVDSGVMVHPLPDAHRGYLGTGALRALQILLKRADVLAVGPGLARHATTRALIRRLLQVSPQPVVLDADGVVAFSGAKRLARPPKAGEVVMTPHPGEMASLLGMTAAAVQRERTRVARQAARRFGAIVLLKGHRTVVTASTATPYLNKTGNPGMASAGVGDVLTGLIAALIGQGMEPLAAARAGAYLHGLAGDLAAKRVGQISLTAGDLLAALPAAFRKAARTR